VISDSRLATQEEQAHNNLMMVVATLTWVMLSCLSERYNKNAVYFQMKTHFPGQRSSFTAAITGKS